MATNEERQKVAARFRDFNTDYKRAAKADNAEWLAIHGISTNEYTGRVIGGILLAVCDDINTPIPDAIKRLADLIEPEPERTCYMTRKFPTYGFYSYKCSNCEEKFHFVHAVKLKFCPACGAKVVADGD